MNGWKPVKKSMKQERFQVQNLEAFFFMDFSVLF